MGAVKEYYCSSSYYGYNQSRHNPYVYAGNTPLSKYVGVGVGFIDVTFDGSSKLYTYKVEKDNHYQIGDRIYINVNGETKPVIIASNTYDSPKNFYIQYKNLEEIK